MSATITMDSTRFQRDFRARVARSKSSLAVTTNRVALDVNKVSFEKTKRADKAAIAALGISAYQIAAKPTKNGKYRLLKRRKIIYADWDKMRFSHIFVANLRKKGINPDSFAPGELERKGKAALGRRMGAVGSVAASFIPILRRIVDALKISDVSFSGVRSGVGTGKGKAVPAVESWSPVCTFELQPIKSESGESDERQTKVLENALQAGFDGAADSMEKYVEKSLNTIWQG